LGAVAATGWSLKVCNPAGALCGLDPADPELDDFGLDKLSGASGSEGGGGGDGVLWGVGERFSVAADMWARCAVAEIQLGIWCGGSICNDSRNFEMSRGGRLLTWLASDLGGCRPRSCSKNGRNIKLWGLTPPAAYCALIWPCSSWSFCCCCSICSCCRLWNSSCLWVSLTSCWGCKRQIHRQQNPQTKMIHKGIVRLLHSPCFFFPNIRRLPSRLRLLNIRRHAANFISHSLQFSYIVHISDAAPNPNPNCYQSDPAEDAALVVITIIVVTTLPPTTRSSNATAGKP
jgi:hypothetical protein